MSDQESSTISYMCILLLLSLLLPTNNHVMSVVSEAIMQITTGLRWRFDNIEPCRLVYGIHTTINTCEGTGGVKKQQAQPSLNWDLP